MTQTIEVAPTSNERRLELPEEVNQGNKRLSGVDCGDLSSMLLPVDKQELDSDMLREAEFNRDMKCPDAERIVLVLCNLGFKHPRTLWVSAAFSEHLPRQFHLV